MTEAELQHAVIECARTLGWLVAHFRPAQTARGWRTPVAGDGKGFPDIVMTRDHRLVFAELKSSTGRLGPDQEMWLGALRKTERVEVVLWKPQDWLDGTIERVLR